MKNSDLIRRIWKNEVVNSKKSRILTLVGKGIGTRIQQTRNRMLGFSPTTDAELFFIVDILKQEEVNVSFYEGEINRKKAKYFGMEYSMVELED